MSYNKPKQILIAPLDWGLGHTSRCVPIIAHLRQQGHDVVLAGNEWQRSFITETFPGIETIHLEGYDVTYSKKGSAFMLNVLTQVPHLLRTIREEHDWLLKLTARRPFDGIISDNRYGLHHPHTPCAFMTHQLQAQSGFGSITDSFLRKLHYKHISLFNDSWVIDVAESPNLGGKLSHPRRLPGNAQFMGLLSQIADTTAPHSDNKHLLILLSGPEPQRSILAELLWGQALKYEGKLVFVEGSGAAGGYADIPAHITHYSRITRQTLHGLLANAHLVICRSGYSTLMDLVAINGKAVLIPTPGQTEQEYLGKHLHQERVFISMAQKGFQLEKALSAATKFPFTGIGLDQPFGWYKRVLDSWVAKL